MANALAINQTFHEREKVRSATVGAGAEISQSF
jgi:hypothetical protein